MWQHVKYAAIVYSRKTDMPTTTNKMTFLPCSLFHYLSYYQLLTKVANI